MAIYALSIRQPWAHLILSGQKTVENRTRRAHLRGPLVIHAARYQPSPEQLEAYGLRLADLTFGCLLGIVELIDCVPVEEAPTGPHTVGPWCLLLSNPQWFAEPIPWLGRLGYFDVSAALAPRDQSPALPPV